MRNWKSDMCWSILVQRLHDFPLCGWTAGFWWKPHESHSAKNSNTVGKPLGLSQMRSWPISLMKYVKKLCYRLNADFSFQLKNWHGSMKHWIFIFINEPASRNYLVKLFQHRKIHLKDVTILVMESLYHYYGYI